MLFTVLKFLTKIPLNFLLRLAYISTSYKHSSAEQHEMNAKLVFEALRAEGHNCAAKQNGTKICFLIPVAGSGCRLS